MIRIPLSARQLQVALQIAIAGTALVVWIAPVPSLRPFRAIIPTQPATTNLPPFGNLPDMQQLTARPLFAQSRRPPPPVPVVSAKPVIIPAKPTPTTDGMILLGVLHDGAKAIALVSLPGDPAPREVGLGAVLGDWVVTRILSDRVLLISGDTTTELVLPRPSAPTSVSPPLNATSSPLMGFPRPLAIPPSSPPMLFPNPN